MIETVAVAASVALVVSVGWTVVVRRLERRKLEAVKAKVFGGR